MSSMYPMISSRDSRIDAIPHIRISTFSSIGISSDLLIVLLSKGDDDGNNGKEY